VKAAKQLHGVKISVSTVANARCQQRNAYKAGAAPASEKKATRPASAAEVEFRKLVLKMGWERASRVVESVKQLSWN
jgi:hypothetical protein